MPDSLCATARPPEYHRPGVCPGSHEPSPHRLPGDVGPPGLVHTRARLLSLPPLCPVLLSRPLRSSSAAPVLSSSFTFVLSSLPRLTSRPPSPKRATTPPPPLSHRRVLSLPFPRSSAAFTFCCVGGGFASVVSLSAVSSAVPCVDLSSSPPPSPQWRSLLTPPPVLSPLSVRGDRTDNAIW